MAASQPVEPIGHLTFDRLNVEAKLGRDEWLDRARTEFSLKQVATAIFNCNDAELAEKVRGGDPDMWLTVVKDFTELRDRYQAGADIFSAVCARLLGPRTRAAR